MVLVYNNKVQPIKIIKTDHNIVADCGMCQCNFDMFISIGFYNIYADLT